MSAKAVFLDRDGVLIRTRVVDGLPYPVETAEAVRFLPGVHGALTLLREHGYLLIVVSNQPDVARGTQRREIVEQINAAIGSELPIDRFSTCFHDDADRCACRKPKPGMVDDAVAALSIDVSNSFMIGDRWRDIEMGARAGVRTILVDYDYAEKISREPDVRVGSITEAVDWIVAQSTQGRYLRRAAGHGQRSSSAGG